MNQEKLEQDHLKIIEEDIKRLVAVNKLLNIKDYFELKLFKINLKKLENYILILKQDSSKSKLRLVK